MVNLQELFVQCVAECNNNKTNGTKKFLVLAKKQLPEVKMSECMEIAGFTSDNEKDSINLAQKFRMNILNPTRNYITKKMFNLTDSAIEELWGRSEKEKTEEQRAMQEAVKAKLPARTRATTSASTMSFLDDIIA